MFQKIQIVDSRSAVKEPFWFDAVEKRIGRNEKLIGRIRGTIDKDCVRIELFEVVTKYRHNGIGKRLMKTLIDAIKSYNEVFQEQQIVAVYVYPYPCCELEEDGKVMTEDEVRQIYEALGFAALYEEHPVQGRTKLMKFI